MKKTLALLLCLAMLFTALSVNVFAVENPSVTIVTNSVSADGDTSFAIKLTGFESLKGLDMTVTATGDIKMLSASALNFKDFDSDEIIKIAEGTDYVISKDGHTLDIVGLQKDVKGDIITVAAKVTGTATIAVTACDLAKSGSELYTAVTAATIAPVSIAPYVKPVSVTVPAIPVGQQTVKIEQSAAGEGYFIPYGSVYTVKDGVYNYKSKDEYGKFDVTADTIVQAFKLPEDGFATFGVSDSAVEEEDAKQFGNITTSYTKDKKYGTLVFIGQWEAFKDYNLSQKGYSEKVLVEKLYAAYNAANPDGKYTFVSFKSGDAVIRVYDVAQKNWMWKNETDGILEYAVRVYGLVDGSEYAAVAYNIDGETVNFANGVKSVSYNAQ